MHLTCGGIFNDRLVANFLENAPVKEFWKIVNIRQTQRYRLTRVCSLVYDRKRHSACKSRDPASAKSLLLGTWNNSRQVSTVTHRWYERVACRQVGWSVKHGRQVSAVNDDSCSACTPAADRLLQTVSEQARSHWNLWAASRRWRWLDDGARAQEWIRASLPDSHRQRLSCDLRLT